MTATHTALRWALRSMLADITYVEAWKSRPLVEARLGEAAWSEDIVRMLKTLAIRWANHCHPRQGLALRKALGEILTDDEQQMLASPSRLPSTRAHSDTPLQPQLETPMIHDTIPNVTQESGGLTESRFDDELRRVAEEFRRPPYFFVDKATDGRLARAIELVRQRKVSQRLDGVSEVQGSTRIYTCTTECSCPYSQQGRSKWCAHLIATALYKAVKARIPAGSVPPTTPEALEHRLTLMQAAPEERLETPPQSDQNATLETQEVPEAMPEPEALGERSVHQNEAVGTGSPPYMKTPRDFSAMDLTPGAIIAAPREDGIAEWAAKRQVLVQFIGQHLVKNVDYGPIHMSRDCKSFREKRQCTQPGHWSKDMLFKSGSEKICDYYGLRPTFHADADTWEMIGRKAGIICLRCDLVSASGQVVGEGRGCRDVTKDGGDPNKAIKMCEKSAQIDAVLRAGALSDAFTLDLDDEEDTPATPEPVNYQDLSAQIREVLRRHGFVGTALAQYEEEILRRTGLTLTRDNYEAILDRLAG
jgi:hypothetical protein